MDDRDEEQLAQIREWWRRNGPSIMLGLSLAIIVVAGWWAYDTWQERAAQQAAAAYAELLEHERRGAELAKLETVARRIREDHAASGYAVLAALRLAKQQVDAGEQVAAAATLDWLVDNAEHTPTVELARLRQARALAESAPEKAVNLLDNDKVSPGFQASYAELRGDLLAELGRADEAAVAYREALAVNDLTPQSRELVKMKLRAVESEA